MATRPQPLAHDVPIVDTMGRPTPQLQTLWDDLGRSGSAPPDIYVRKGQLSGWASPTGTLTRSTFTTYPATTAGASYSQAQMQALMNHVQALSERLAAVITDNKTAQLFTP